MIEIHGHRGSRGTHPENTIPSFAEAADAGAPFVELDLHLSKDGHLVVYHDFEMGGRLLSDLTLAEIQAHPALAGGKIPSFEELMLWKAKSAPALRLNVEIKRDARRPKQVPSSATLAKATLDALGSRGLLEESLVQSFDFEVVRAARALNPLIRLSCLFESDAPIGKIAQDMGAQVAAPHHVWVRDEHVQDCQSRGIEVLPWTVNDSKDASRLVGLGVGAFITDFPRRFISIYD